jgi:hypothetical protein
MPLSNACPKFPPRPDGSPGLSRMEEKAEKSADYETELRKCYAKVDKRDGKVCRVSGVPLTAGDGNKRRSLMRHHMKPKSLAKSERTNPANVITISAWVHDQIHTKAALHLEGDANAKDENGKLCGVLLSANGETGWQPVRMV